ncbi:hypothetical protein P2318_07130 [Myxococcaceae bacterium GXIMD 01537]
MTKKIVSATAVLIGAGSLLAGCSFDQPSAGCITQDATTWQAAYTLVADSSAPVAGSGRSEDECKTSTATKLQGELLGVFKFSNPKDLSDAKLVIRPTGLAALALRDPGNPDDQNAIGKMSTKPDAQEFCTATGFNEAKANAPAVGGDATANPPVPPTTPAASVSYKFDNVSVYASPNAPGTQLKGDLTYAKDGCSAKYTMKAVWPSVGCDPESDKPKDNCGEGSGANPDFALECHPTLHVCVPSKDIPSFK